MEINNIDLLQIASDIFKVSATFASLAIAIISIVIAIFGLPFEISMPLKVAFDYFLWSSKISATCFLAACLFSILYKLLVNYLWILGVSILSFFAGLFFMIFTLAFIWYTLDLLLKMRV